MSVHHFKKLSFLAVALIFSVLFSSNAYASYPAFITDGTTITYVGCQPGYALGSDWNCYGKGEVMPPGVTVISPACDIPGSYLSKESCQECGYAWNPGLADPKLGELPCTLTCEDGPVGPVPAPKHVTVNYDDGTVACYCWNSKDLPKGAECHFQMIDLGGTTKTYPGPAIPKHACPVKVPGYDTCVEFSPGDLKGGKYIPGDTYIPSIRCENCENSHGSSQSGDPIDFKCPPGTYIPIGLGTDKPTCYGDAMMASDMLCCIVDHSFPGGTTITLDPLPAKPAPKKDIQY